MILSMIDQTFIIREIKDMNKNSETAILDYIGISPEYRSEIISKYIELSFSIGRAIAEKKGRGCKSQISHSSQCKMVIQRLLECEISRAKLIPPNVKKFV